MDTVTIKGSTFIKYLMDPQIIMHLQQTLSSYLGHFKHANSANLISSIFAKNSWLYEFFYLIDHRIKNKFRPKYEFKTLFSQVVFFQNRLNPCLVIFKMEKFFEFFGRDAVCAAKLLGLKYLDPRKRLAPRTGFPIWLKENMLEKLLVGMHDVAVVDEDLGRAYVKHRYVNLIYRRKITAEEL